MLHSTDSPKALYHAYVKQLSLPLWETTCLLEGGVGKNINGNVFALLRELRTNLHYQDIKPVWAVDESLLEAAQARLDAYGLTGVRLVVTESDEYNECLARAKYLLSDNTFPAYLTKRPEQIYLNTWHGTPLKRLGLSDIKNSLRSFANVQKNLLTADYLLFPNEFTRDVFMDDYSLAPFFAHASVVHDYPRNDAFANEELYHHVRDAEGIESGQQAIAYLPTWRGVGRTADSEGQIVQTTELLAAIDAGLHDNQTLFVNLHFTVQGSIDFTAFRHVRPFPEHYETYDFLAACDALVTDYSSVMFDYAVTGRPIVLLAYDEDEYMASKGTYFPYRELPFPIVATPEALVGQLAQPRQPEGYEAFQQRFCAHHTGHAACEVLDLLLDGNAEGLSIARHQPASVDEALYVFSLGKRRVRETVLPQIIERAAASDKNVILVTTASYSEGAIEAFQQLYGKVHLLVIVRRHVQTRGEQALFDLVSQHQKVAKLLEDRLRDYFAREAHQMFCGVDIRRFCALAPDGSYPMWMAKGLRAQLVAPQPDAGIVGKRAAHEARVCLTRGWITGAR